MTAKKGLVLPSLLATGVLALLSASILGVTEGLTLLPGLAPPSGVRSSNTVATNSDVRYNLNTGAAFTISCTSTHTSDDFTVSFYKDGMVISDGDLVNTTLTETVTSTTQKFIQLEFLDFQPVYDGVYHCFASASDTDEELSSNLYLYGSGEDESPPPPVVRVTPRYVVLDNSTDLVLEARFRGNFYSHEWVYNENDLTFLTGSMTLFSSATVTNVGQTFTIPAGSASLRVGYYGPRVLPTLTGTFIRPTPENTVIIGSFVAATASINGLDTAQVTAAAGDDVSFTCLARGFPETTITIQLSGVNASYTIGNQTLMTEAMPTSSMEVTRTVTLHSVTVLDCGAVVTCEGSNMDGDWATHPDPANATLQVQAHPTVGVTPSEPVLSVGNMLTLTCTGGDCVGTTTFTFSWFLDGSPVRASLVTSIDGTMSQLSVTSVTSADFGTYTCNVTNEHGTGSAVAYVREGAFPVPFITPEAPDPVVPGSSIILTCASHGMGPFNLTWSVNEILLARAEEVNTPLSLTVDLVSTDNYTSYTCTSQNRDGVNSTSVTLEQAVPPVVTVVGDHTVTVTVNDSFSLQVTISQYNLQPVTVEWERNDVPLSSAEKYQLSSDTSQLGNGSAELTVQFTESLVDNGTYTVTASNAAGNGSVDFEVFIMIAPEAAILASQKPTVTFSEGASGALMCTATGVPAPTISWFWNGVLLSDDNVTLVITSSTDDTMSLLSVSSTLNVTSVTRDSAFANITCTASNGVGANSSDSTQLIVLFASNVTAISANQRVTSPAPVSFNCTVDSYPPSNITWLHNGAEIQAVPPRVTISTVQVDNRTQESTLTLLNTTAVDIGTYTCSAMNDEGSNSTTTELQVLVRPTVTLSPSVSGPVSVRDVVIFTCTASGGVPSEYSFRWFNGSVEVMSGDSVGITSDGSTSTLMLTVGPDDFVNYTCSVNNTFTEASDSIVLMEASFPVPFITPEAPDPVVLGSSITLTCASHGIGPFNLTWSVNGILLTREEEINTSLSFTVDLVSTDDYTSYTCTSQNRDGVNSTSVTLEPAVPAPLEPLPTPALNGTGLTVAVPIVECSDMNGTISHYQIVVVSYSPGVSFDRSRPPNEVFGEDRFVPYETAMPASDQLLVYVAAEFAADLFPENKMFTLGSGGPNDNDKYTNPTLQHSTAYTYFVICLPDTTPDSLSDPPAQRVTSYSLAGFSSFGSVYTTPADPTDVTTTLHTILILLAICVTVTVVIVIASMVIAVAVFRRKWADYRSKHPLPNPVYKHENMGIGSGGMVLANMPKNVPKNPVYVAAEEAVTSFSSIPEEDKEKEHKAGEVQPFEANQEMVQRDTTHGCR